MASLSSSKVACKTCGKPDSGVFKCEGCAQAFCRQHVIEHRDILSIELEKVVLERDTLQQTILEYRDHPYQYNALMDNVHEWEKNAIQIISKTADEIRQQITELFGFQIKIATEKLQDLSRRLQQAHKEDTYVETDIQTWQITLETLKSNITNAFQSINVHKESITALITKPYISSRIQPTSFEERFGKISGDIIVRNDGRVIEHGSKEHSDAIAYAIGEYSCGKHRVRFIINKNTGIYIMSFNIMSTSFESFQKPTDDVPVLYGWQTDDSINNPDHSCISSIRPKDLDGETMLQLELLIDCDNKKIAYFNEKTKYIREMNVDIKRCPFPWQLEFYLHDVGDRVEILSSTHEY